MQSTPYWHRWKASFRSLPALLMLWAPGALAQSVDDDDDDYDALPGRTEEQIDALVFNFDEVVETIALYASLMSVLVIILLLAMALRLKTWAAYIGLTILSMAWFALFEQVFTGLYWLGLDIGYPVLVILGFALASLHLVLAGVSIDTDRPFGKVRPVLFGAAVAIWGILALHWPIMPDVVPAAFVAVALIAISGHLMAVPSFFAKESPTVKVARNGLFFALIALVLLLVIVLFGEITEDLDLVFVGRLVQLSVVGFFFVFLVRHAMTLLKDRDIRIKTALKAAQRDAEQSKALLETERKYSRAREVARRHTMRLATASHDIRQPLASLRSTMTALTKDRPDDVDVHLNAALDYLDQLAESYIDTEETSDSEQGPLPAPPDPREVIAAEMLCATLDRMFRKEAEAKGLTFAATAASANLKAEPLALMRILSNLLSNAIKHTPSGEVTLIGTRKDEGYVFSVQNSANLPKQSSSNDVFAAFEKGQESDGSGLGLSIVKTLSSRSGLHLTWSSPPGEGTIFSLAVKEV